MSNQRAPRKVYLVLAATVVISESCEQTSCMALTNIGELNSFSYNGVGNFGILAAMLIN